MMNVDESNRFRTAYNEEIPTVEKFHSRTANEIPSYIIHSSLQWLYCYTKSFNRIRFLEASGATEWPLMMGSLEETVFDSTKCLDPFHATSCVFIAHSDESDGANESEASELVCQTDGVHVRVDSTCYRLGRRPPCKNPNEILSRLSQFIFCEVPPLFQPSSSIVFHIAQAPVRCPPNSRFCGRPNFWLGCKFPPPPKKKENFIFNIDWSSPANGYLWNMPYGNEEQRCFVHGES